MRILIVDDVQDYLNSLTRALKGDFEILTATSLQEAKEKIDKTVSVALVDVRLSETDVTNRDGIVYLAHLKTLYPQIPVIMMSAYRDFDAATDALNLGAAHYLKKPINLRELKELIKSVSKEVG